MNTYEVIGRQVERAENAELRLNQAISVIKALKEGDLTLDRITLRPDGFTVVPTNGLVEKVPDAAS